MIHPQFPIYAALINPVTASAFALRFVETMSFFETVTLEPYDVPRELQILDRSTKFRRCDAGLMLSPYVRLGKMPKDLTEQVRKAKISMRLDGALLFTKHPLWIFERDSDGCIPPGPWCDIESVQDCLFRGTLLRSPHGPASGDPNDAIGFFLPNDSLVQAFIYDLPKDATAKMEIEVGLILGHYTTESEDLGQDAPLRRDDDVCA